MLNNRLKSNRFEQRIGFFYYICGVQNSQGGMLMSTKNEQNQFEKRVDTKRAESSTTERTPSIWYT